MSNCPEIKILIIDDEKPILKLFNRILDRFGFAVDVAENAEEGIKKLALTLTT
jgi:DNA-binding response OmpR family regulator